MTFAASPSLRLLPSRFAAIVVALREMVAARAGLDGGPGRLVALAWVRLNGMAARFEALVARMASGRPARRPGGAGQARAVESPAARRAGGDRDNAEPHLPRRFAWLVRAMPETAQLAGQVQALLDDPAMMELLAAAPQAGRIMGPLCRMLGLPRWPAAPELPAPREPEPAQPQAAPLWQALVAEGVVAADWKPERPERPPKSFLGLMGR